MRAIRFFNRYSGAIETEAVYGEAWLRWTYGTIMGKILLWAIVKRSIFSQWYGWRMRLPGSRGRISEFCKKYRVCLNESVVSIDDFKTFNEFFIRRLRAESRPVEKSASSIVFPADGRHLGYSNLSEIDGIYVKDQRFTLESLLLDPALVEKYREGSAVISRLCPVDCHRFHYPVAGKTSAPVRIDGYLYSVNPYVLRKGIWRLFSNRRTLTRIESDKGGCVIMVEVGATCVGSIRQLRSGEDLVERGEEKGYFEFGGSAIITLFESGRVMLADDLLRNTCEGRELYAHYGDRMGSVR